MVMLTSGSSRSPRAVSGNVLCLSESSLTLNPSPLSKAGLWRQILCWVQMGLLNPPISLRIN